MATAIEYRPLASLIVNPRNPKAHDTQAVAASVSRFGFIEPIVIDERTGFIISGHGRRRSLLDSQINGDPIPEGVTLADDGDWLIPVVTGYSSRDDNEATGALIALNRTNELGGWVDDELLNLLETLSQVDDGLEGVGYTDGDITALGDLLENFASFGQSSENSEDVEMLPRDLDSLLEEVGEVTDRDLRRKVVLELSPDEARKINSLIGNDLDQHDYAASLILKHWVWSIGVGYGG